MLVLKLSAPRAFVHPLDDAFFDPDREEFPVGDDGERDYQAAKARFAEGWAEYEKTGDVSRIPCREGRKPTVVRYKGLTPQQAEYVDQMSFAVKVAKDGSPMVQPGGLAMLTIAYGVVGIDNLREEKQLEDGSIVLEDAKVTRVDTDFGPRLSDDSLRLFTDADLRGLVSRRIRQASKLLPEQRKSDNG